MPYEILEEKIKSLPYKYYIQVENFVKFMIFEAKREENEKSVSQKMSEICQKIDSGEQTFSCNATLESWRELTKNDSW